MDNCGLTLNGGPNHIGTCHNCEEPNGSNHDGLCEHCQSMQPRECPLCGCNYEWTEITEHGICSYCLDLETEMLETVNETTILERVKFRIKEEEQFSINLIKAIR